MTQQIRAKSSAATDVNVETMAKMLKLLQEKANKSSADGEFKFRDVGVRREGTQITLPETMTNEEAIACLERKIEEEETVIAIHEEVVAHPLDGSYALMETLRKIYGWHHAAPTPGFFGPRPPVMVNLEVSHNESVQVVWGGFKIPGVEGDLQTNYSRKNGQIVFAISGKVKQKHKEQIKYIADQVRLYVREKSVYKGKAIRIRTTEDGELNFDFEYAPQFLDLSKTDENDLIFSEEVRHQVQTSIFTPIEKTEMCRKFGIPLRRGILLEGKYGTGKTLTANVTAKKCVENGWTFIYLDRVLGLPDALLFARQYSPAVIFAEDIDRVVTGGRSAEVDDVLNNIDGVDSKGFEIMTILTTNDVEKINKAMLRPGRLDAVISVLPPDTEAAGKLLKLYARGLMSPNEDVSAAAVELDGQIPAVIREVVERAKLEALYRMGAADTLQLTAADLATAARSMKNHLRLMTPREEVVRTSAERLGDAFKEVVVDVGAAHVGLSQKTFDYVESRL